jgi:hypothetical protein
MKKTRIAAALALAGVTAAAGGCGSSSGGGVDSTATRAARVQQVTVLAGNHSFSAQGIDSLHAGLVSFTIRDVSPVPHGAGLVRLRPGISPARAAKIVGGDNIPAHLPFTLLGGVPQLQPGGSWQGTLDLAPGRYAMFDDGANAKGMLRGFSVRAAAGAQAPPPKTVGTIVMRDFAFGIHLPQAWNGKGVVKVPNVGKEIHELTFIRMTSAAEERKLTAELHKGYPSGPEPKGITFAQGGTSPGQTAYVRVDLKPGRYLAVCLFPDPKTGKPHTALGMLSTLTVH